MVVVTVMSFADKNDALGGQLSDKPIQRKSRVQIDRF
jgi:hypothetical protein